MAEQLVDNKGRTGLPGWVWLSGLSCWYDGKLQYRDPEHMQEAVAKELSERVLAKTITPGSMPPLTKPAAKPASFSMSYRIPGTKLFITANDAGWFVQRTGYNDEVIDKGADVLKLAQAFDSLSRVLYTFMQPVEA